MADSADDGNLWSKTLAEVQSRSASSLPATSVVVLGDRDAGKSSLLSRIARKDETRPSGGGLEYHYLEVNPDLKDGTYEHQQGSVLGEVGPGESGRVGVWVVDSESGSAYSDLGRFALPSSHLSSSLGLICISMSEPWTIMESLQRWSSWLEAYLSTLDPRLVTQAREAQVRFWQEYVEPPDSSSHSDLGAKVPSMEADHVLLPLAETTLTHNLGLPCVVVVTKCDTMSQLEKEYDYKDEHFVFIQLHIRKFCLNYGAALVYTSAMESRNTEILYKYILHRLFEFPFTQSAAVVEKDSIFIPAGWDSEKKIGKLHEKLRSFRPDDPFSEHIKKRVQQRPQTKDAELAAEEDQAFLAKQQNIIASQAAPNPKAAPAASVEDESPELAPSVPPGVRTTYQCPICVDKSFPSELALNNHRVKTHKKTYTPTCEVCSQKFLSAKRLGAHKWKKHRDQAAPLDQVKKFEGSIICGLCWNNFRKMTFLCEHLIREHGEAAHLEQAEFTDWAEFEAWKLELETTSASRFVRKRSAIPSKVESRRSLRTGRSLRLGNWSWRRPLLPALSANDLPFPLRKLGFDCSAHLYVSVGNEMASNRRVSVDFCRHHYGHDRAPHWLPIPDATRERILSLLSQQWTKEMVFQEIQREAREAMAIGDSGADRLALISRHDIAYIVNDSKRWAECKARRKEKEEARKAKKEAGETGRVGGKGSKETPSTVKETPSTVKETPTLNQPIRLPPPSPANGGPPLPTEPLQSSPSAMPLGKGLFPFPPNVSPVASPAYAFAAHSPEGSSNGGYANPSTSSVVALRAEASSSGVPTPQPPTSVPGRSPAAQPHPPAHAHHSPASAITAPFSNPSSSGENSNQDCSFAGTPGQVPGQILGQPSPGWPTGWPGTGATPIRGVGPSQSFPPHRPAPVVPSPANTVANRDSLSVVDRLTNYHAYDPVTAQSRLVFFQRLLALSEQKGTNTITNHPTVSKQPVDLHDLYKAVQERGGFVMVSLKNWPETGGWWELCQLFQISSCYSAVGQLKHLYDKYLFDFECAHERGSCDPELIRKALEPPQSGSPMETPPISGAGGTPASGAVWTTSGPSPEPPMSSSSSSTSQQHYQANSQESSSAATLPYVHPSSQPNFPSQAQPSSASSHPNALPSSQGPSSLPKPYVCDHPGCGKTVKVPRAHFLVHENKRPFACEFAGCTMAFNFSYQLTRHRRRHTGSRPFACKFAGCTKAFSVSCSLRTHQRTHIASCPFSCEFAGCKKTFKHFHSLKNHRGMHTGERFVCPTCGKGYTYSSDLTKHQKTHGSGQAILLNEESLTQPPTSVSQSQQPYPANSQESSSAPTPPYVHPSSQPNFLSQAPSAPSHPNALPSSQGHSSLPSSVQPSPYPYQTEEAEWGIGQTEPQTETELEANGGVLMEGPGKRKLHVCEYPGCGKTYRYMSGLREHRRVHENKRLFACQFPGCMKTFNFNYLLTRHRRTHTGEKRFVCPICSKGYTQRHVLTKHQKTHGSGQVILLNEESLTQPPTSVSQSQQPYPANSQESSSAPTPPYVHPSSQPNFLSQAPSAPSHPNALASSQGHSSLPSSVQPSVRNFSVEL